jgi:hypothetical protein
MIHFVVRVGGQLLVHPPPAVGSRGHGPVERTSRGASARQCRPSPHRSESTTDLLYVRVSFVVSVESSPSSSELPPADAPSPKPADADVGPDPVHGIAIGAFGLVNMALGGATTQHLWFNVGEGLLLLGAAVFLGSVAITHFKQRGFPTLAEIRERMTAPLRGKAKG